MCHTGGEQEVMVMKKALENRNIKVVGWVVLEPACHLNNDKRLLRVHKCEVDPNLDCIWDVIYKRLKKEGQLHLLKAIQEPKDWSKSTIMQMTI